MSAITEAGERAAEAVRELNHRTMPGAGELEYPADVYIVIGDMLLMVQRLPQLFDQVAKWLDAEHDAGRVGHDSGEDPGVYVAIVRAQSLVAQGSAWSLEDALKNIHEASAHLTGITEG